MVNSGEYGGETAEEEEEGGEVEAEEDCGRPACLVAVVLLEVAIINRDRDGLVVSRIVVKHPEL